jgi:rhamnopyranosyl-N-acetylglucosaminyl-diphospho-decaprenol beta-1,3/1,4-galactofuranosyltransferase
VPGGAVACVVLTRDRWDLLRECLEAVLAQTRPVDRLIVVDNASSDGTPARARAEFPEAELLELTENSGASGGFAAGIRAAMASRPQWVWLLDDDTIAHADALERLLGAGWSQAGLPEPALLASRVDWSDGRPHPMNMPILRRRDPDGLVRAAAAGLLRVRTATFVSLLLSGAAVERHGGPCEAFFYQADDIEYTARILRDGHGYVVPESVVEHRTPTPGTFVSDPVRFYFHLRNTLYMLRGTAWAPAEKPALVWLVFDSAARFLRLRRLSRESVATVGRALRDGVRGPAGV